MAGLDISDVLAAERAAIRHLEREVPREMHRIVADAAQTERREHTYQNRTGDLERATKATETVITDDVVQVSLVAEEEYASFVNKRGYMVIDESAQQAELEIEYFLDGASF